MLPHTGLLSSRENERHKLDVGLLVKKKRETGTQMIALITFHFTSCHNPITHSRYCNVIWLDGNGRKNR